MRTLIAFAALAVLLLAGPALAASVDAQGAWIRTPPPGALTAAGYATLVNHARVPDHLMDGRSTVATEVGIHQMLEDGGVMRMRPIPGGLLVPAVSEVRLEPDGAHLMLMGLKRPLHVGQHVRIVLRYAHAGLVPVDFVVKDAP